MSVLVNIQTTTAQDNKLTRLLDGINTQRVSSGQTPYSDINALSTDILTDQLFSWVKAMNDQEAQQIAQAYNSATNSVKNQVKSLLGIS